MQDFTFAPKIDLCGGERGVKQVPVRVYMTDSPTALYYAREGQSLGHAQLEIFSSFFQSILYYQGYHGQFHSLTSSNMCTKNAFIHT